MSMFFRSLILAFFVLLLGFPTAEAFFNDLPERHRYYGAIETLAEESIISGYPDGLFRPDRTINRAEFVHILSEAFLTDLEVNPRCFPDVEADAWYALSVCRARSQGIVSGYPNGEFVGIQPINFVEAAHVLYLFRHPDPRTVPEDQWFAPASQYLSDQHAIPVSVSELHEALTRGEASFMIAQLLSPEAEALSNVYEQGSLRRSKNSLSLHQLRSELTRMEASSVEEVTDIPAEEVLEVIEESGDESSDAEEQETSRRRRGGGSNVVPEDPTSGEENLAPVDDEPTSTATSRRATWIWNHGSSSPQDYVDMTMAEQITDVFLSSYDPAWAGEYIALLHEQAPDVSVQLISEGACALDIDPSCGTQHLTVYSDPQQVKDYVKLNAVNDWLTANNTGIRVEGIHYDVEAYHAPGSFWQCENDGSYGKCSIDNYLEMVRQVMIPLHQEGLSQSVVWGSSRNTTPDAGSSYAADFERLITNADYQTAIDDVVLLAYHDEHTVSDVSQAFDVANAVCTSSCPGIFPAIETEDIGIDVVSFAEEGRAAADAVIQLHRDTYGSSPFFAGVGIHWLLPYHEMP